MNERLWFEHDTRDTSSAALTLLCPGSRAQSNARHTQHAGSRNFAHADIQEWNERELRTDEKTMCDNFEKPPG
jgi:hypothetical protein